MSSDDTKALGRSLRLELSDEAPQGFAFNDHVLRQDAALERLTERLRALSPEEVEGALAVALLEEKNGWVLLKLLELSERLALPGVAPALLELLNDPPAEGDRRRFLAGRASEVLIRLPLDLKMRALADAATKLPLQEVQRFRLGAAREQLLHRPRRVEWALMVSLMVVGLGGLWFAFQAV